VTAVQSATSYSFRYDLVGRVTSETQTTDGLPFQNSFLYDAFGRIRERTYPDPAGSPVDRSSNSALPAMTRVQKASTATTASARALAGSTSEWSIAIWRA